jgi:hypothetical protein
MVIVKESLAVLPVSSVASQLTVVAPIGKIDPEGGLHETIGIASTMLVAEVAKLTTAY